MRGTSKLRFPGHNNANVTLTLKRDGNVGGICAGRMRGLGRSIIVGRMCTEGIFFFVSECICEGCVVMGLACETSLGINLRLVFAWVLGTPKPVRGPLTVLSLSRVEKAEGGCNGILRQGDLAVVAVPNTYCSSYTDGACCLQPSIVGLLRLISV